MTRGLRYVSFHHGLNGCYMLTCIYIFSAWKQEYLTPLLREGGELSYYVLYL